MPVTASAPAIMFLAVTQAVIASCDLKGTSLYKGVSQLFPGVGINLLDSGSGNMHVFTALFLGKAFPVDQANCFIFIYI